MSDPTPREPDPPGHFHGHTDWWPRCDFQQGTCPSEAAWAGRLECCNEVFFACWRHALLAVWSETSGSHDGHDVGAIMWERLKPYEIP